MNNEQIRNIEKEEIDLRELWEIIVNGKVLIIILTTLVTIGAIIWALTRTPIYEVKSTVQVGFIENNLITDTNSLVKILNIVFNIEDKLASKNGFISQVSSISVPNKKIKKFIEIKTEAITNEDALAKNKEVLEYILKEYKPKIKYYKTNNINAIKSLEKNIEDTNNLEVKNIKRELELLKTQKIVKIDEQIKRLNEQDIKNIKREIELLKTQTIVQIDNDIYFSKNIKLQTIDQKIKFHKKKLNEYTQSVKKLYESNIKNRNSSIVAISSMQIVNYQNLILNSQNKIEDLNIEIKIINTKNIPELERQKKNIKDITIKVLELKIDNIKNVTIKDLERQKKNIESNVIRKLTYKLNIKIPNKIIKLEESINKLKFNNTYVNVQNSKIVGDYVVHDYPVKPRKKLIVVVAFITGLILSIFILFFLNFIAKINYKRPSKVLKK